jgi:hypothetical protein
VPLTFRTQKLLRDQNAIALLVGLLETIFDKDTGVVPADLEKAENFSVSNIVKVCFVGRSLIQSVSRQSLFTSTALLYHRC